MSKPSPACHRATDRSEYNEALRRRGFLAGVADLSEGVNAQFEHFLDRIYRMNRIDLWQDWFLILTIL